jgi:UDP-N-acetylglucosamine transferase subunit ALG13
MTERTPSLPLVFVTVGTDFHQFDRLVGWVDSWLEAGNAGRARVVVQAGASTPPRVAEARTFLEYDEMRDMVAAATAVVCQAGPGTIALVSALGKRPVIVPRRAALGEVVDDHQRAFAARLAADGSVVLVEDEEGLHQVLDRALSEPGWLLQDAAAADEDGAVSRLEALVDGLFQPSPRRLPNVGSEARA